MADKVKKLGIERDYKKFLYYIDASGSVCRKPKSGADAEVIAGNVITREKGWLYFLDREGDVSRSPMAAKKASAAKPCNL